MFDAGLGIRSADSHASAAFLSSSFEYESIVSRPLDDPSPDLPDVDGALQHLSGVLCLDEPIIKEAVLGIKQHGLSLKIDSFRHQKL